MHETSLSQVLIDYLTGEEIAETSYEEFRQALARLMVEEKGYPRDRLRAKVGIHFPVEGREYCRVADVVAYDDSGRALLAIFFAAGQPGSFDREIVAGGRLFPGGPVGLVACTNTEEAVLHETATGKLIGKGMAALPDYDDLQALADKHPAPRLTPEQEEKERRVLFAYSEFLYGTCCHTVCPTPDKTPAPNAKSKK